MTGAIEKVLRALNEEGVRYLVVGGVAVVLHGHLRTTADLDLVVDFAPENLLRALSIFKQLGYRPRAPVPIEWFSDAAQRQSWIRDKGLRVFSLWSQSDPTLEIDLFVEEPFDFSAVYDRALHVELDTTTAPLIDLPGLIALKRAANRPQDKADIEALEALVDSGDSANE